MTVARHQRCEAGRGCGRVVLAAFATLLLSALPAEAQRRSAAMASHCGFGHGPADSSMQPGGGGDTLVIGDPEDIFHHVFDSASPVSAHEHDRIIFTDLKPEELEFKRVGDHLILCHSRRRYELLIESHYCRGTHLSAFDTPNSEVEVFIFASAGEIWATDLMFAEHQGEPERLLDGVSHDSLPYRFPAGGWKLHPFSRKLPDWTRPPTTCGGG